ncbi:MAG: hypothetical protein JOZ72_15675 [Alphaproteobacteria bacterium]|nr:hypothetical protein [Alphaproteobacteria bacterium]
MSSLDAKCTARLASSLASRSEDLVSRAAGFRIEADVLRGRAREAGDTMIRSEYLSLADRWSLCAAHLEAEAIVKLLDVS